LTGKLKEKERRISGRETEGKRKEDDLQKIEELIENE